LRPGSLNQPFLLLYRWPHVEKPQDVARNSLAGFRSEFDRKKFSKNRFLIVVELRPLFFLRNFKFLDNFIANFQIAFGYSEL